MDNPTADIKDTEIKNIMDQYFKIVTIIKEDCERRGIVFMGYGYIRKGDNIKDTGSYSIISSTAIEPYDQWRAEKDFNEQLMG